MRDFICLLIMCSSVLAGCTPGATRDCPAFGSALADRWSTALNEGDEVVFANQSGELLTLSLVSRVDTEPFTTDGQVPGSVEVDDIKCVVSSERQFVFSNGDAILSIIIDESIPNDPNAATDLLSVGLSPQTSVGEPILPAGYLILLGDLFRPALQPEFNIIAINPLASRSLNPIDVNGNVDGFAVEQIYTDTSLVFDAFVNASIDTNSPAAIVRVVLAEGGPNPSGTLEGEVFNGGLIEFETVSGEIYTRQ